MRMGLVLPFMIVWLLLPAERHPALALTQRQINLAGIGLGITGFSSVVYYLYQNSPAQRAAGYEENLGPGEWYLGAYTGVSVLPAVDWDLGTGFNRLRDRTAHSVGYEPAILGGVKFGRYRDNLPWFGWEWEVNFARHAVRPQPVKISPALADGRSSLSIPFDRFYLFSVQFNLLARYGFLKDKEVTFGRLQPYVGIGPSIELLYSEQDAAKNLGLTTLAGIRYMCTYNLALFMEYKFGYQFAVEVEKKEIIAGERGTVSFDVPRHRLVLGVSYHFKNLFGN